MVEFLGPFELGMRFLDPPQQRQIKTVNDRSGRIVGIKFDGLFDFFLGPLPIPVLEFDPRHGGVGFGQRGVDLHELPGALSDLLVLVGNKAAPEVNLQQRGVARSKVRIDSDSAIDALQGLLLAFPGRFVEVQSRQLVEARDLRVWSLLAFEGTHPQQRPKQQRRDNDGERDLLCNGEAVLNSPFAPDRLAVLQQSQLGLHFFCVAVTLARVGLAGFEEDGVEFDQLRRMALFSEIAGELRELLAVFAGADFVKHFAQTVEIGLGFARPFRWNETFGADVRARTARVRDQTDVRQLWNSVDDENVGRFDVAVDQSMSMEVRQRRRHTQDDLNAFRQG